MVERIIALLQANRLIVGLLLIFVVLVGLMLGGNVEPSPVRDAQPTQPVASDATRTDTRTDTTAAAPGEAVQANVQVETTAVPLPRQAERTTLFDFDRSQVEAVAIEVAQSGERIILQRIDDSGDEWAMLNDTSLTADTTLALVRTALELPYISQFTPPENESLTSYGLSESSVGLLIQIVMQDETGHAIAIGNFTGNGDHYATVDDDPDIYVVPAAPIAFFTVILRQIFPVTP